VLRIKPFLIVCLIAWIVLGILEWSTSRIEIVDWAHHFGNATSDFFFRFYTHIGEIPMILGSLVAIYFYRKPWFKYALLAIVINTIIVQALKFGISAPRPYWELGDRFREIEGVHVLRSLSFPSGHSAAAILSCGIFASLVNKPWQQILLALAALLVGYSRIYLGLHYSLDVWVGISIGLANLILFLYLTQSEN